MMRRIARVVVLPLTVLFSISLLLGCATSYSSLSGSEAGGNKYSEIVVGDEALVMESISQAIHQEFPAALVQTFQDKSFNWFHQPLLDRTNFRVAVKSVSGVDELGKTVTGYFYTVSTSGTQGFVEARYVSPLNNAIREAFKNNGLTTVAVASINEADTVKASVARKQIPVTDVDLVPVLKSSLRKHGYAVVIGIEQYREKLPKADFADRDAKLVGDYLTKVLGYPEENVIVRVNDRVTRTDMEKYFEGWLPNNVEKDSSVFIYYSGHGAPNPKSGDAYLVPYDGDPAFVEKTAYSLKRLYAALDRLPAKEITVVLDSCFSGAGGRSVLAEGARPIVLLVENAILAGGKITVLAASSGDQISSTFKDKGHGLLTYFFLKGLQGDGDLNKDGLIDMAELYEYVKPNVQKVARKEYNNEQTPQLLASPEVLRKGGGRLLELSK